MDYNPNVIRFCLTCVSNHFVFEGRVLSTRFSEMFWNFDFQICLGLSLSHYASVPGSTGGLYYEPLNPAFRTESSGMFRSLTGCSLLTLRCQRSASEAAGLSLCLP